LLTKQMNLPGRNWVLTKGKTFDEVHTVNLRCHCYDV